MVLVPECPLLLSLLCRCSFLTGACIRLGLVFLFFLFFFFKEKKKKNNLGFPIQIKTTMRCHLTLLGMLLLKSQEVTTVGKNVEK